MEKKQGSDEPELTEREGLIGECLKRKMGTARRDTRGWEMAMQRAREQARRYARALPTKDGRPPFLVAVDGGYCFDLYADFLRQRKTNVQFPDSRCYRIYLDALADLNVRALLRRLWLDPMALDPSRRTARVMRDWAENLARVAASLEKKHPPDQVAWPGARLWRASQVDSR